MQLSPDWIDRRPESRKILADLDQKRRHMSERVFYPDIGVFYQSDRPIKTLWRRSGLTTRAKKSTTRVISKLPSKDFRPYDVRPTLLSVFTGAGGLDIGLEAAGFRIVGCIEIDEAARKTIAANRPNWKLLDGDVAANRRLDPLDLGLRRRDLSLLAGAPPCQPFSKAAQWARSGRTGLNDSRSDCIRIFFELVETFLPRVILIENVPGFVDRTCDVRPFIKGKLAVINRRNRTRYEFETRVLNAAEFGVPQRRHRAIVIAIRDGCHFSWPEPNRRVTIRAWDALSTVRVSKPPRASGQWADLLPSIPEGKNYQFHTRKGEGLPLFGYRTKFWSFLLKLDRLEPAWTIPAQAGPSTGPFHWNNRPLSTAEIARLQTFPSCWRFEGLVRDQIKQIGNATPPLLAETLGRQIGRTIFGLKYKTRLKFVIPRRHSVARKRNLEPVPKKYRFLVANHLDHPGPGKGPRPLINLNASSPTTSP